MAASTQLDRVYGSSFTLRFVRVISASTAASIKGEILMMIRGLPFDMIHLVFTCVTRAMSYTYKVSLIKSSHTPVYDRKNHGASILA